jgi:hypothetical protein
MITLSAAVSLAVMLSLLAIRLGLRKPSAVGVAIAPSVAAFVYFAIRRDIDFGPHGGLFPA